MSSQYGVSSPTTNAPSVIPGIMAESAPGSNASAGSTFAAPLPAQRTATAKSAHEMIIATAIMIVVIYILVIVAGMSQGAGRAVLALFFMAIIIQGLMHPGTVLNFVKSNPLVPPSS